MFNKKPKNRYTLFAVELDTKKLTFIESHIDSQFADIVVGKRSDGIFEVMKNRYNNSRRIYNSLQDLLMCELAIKKGSIK